MANSPQSIKRARQAETRRQRNQGVNTKFRTMVKRARAHAADDSAQDDFVAMQSAADIAARKGIIHPRKASRLKKRVNNAIVAAHTKSEAAAAAAQKAEEAQEPEVEENDVDDVAENEAGEADVSEENGDADDKA